MLMPDLWYFVFLAPGILLAMWAQWRVHAAYSWASGIGSGVRATGAETAAAILRAEGIADVGIEPVEGQLSDHYDPQSKVLRLSEGVYGSESLAALGIAAHEAGHALQDAHRYPLMALRGALVPMASLGSGMSWFVILAGTLMLAAHLALGKVVLLAGIGLFSLTVLFQLVNLPVEFDASRRARIALLQNGLVSREEDAVVAKVLDAAALTYVAATLTSILTLLYYLWRSGLLGNGGRDE
ncbi:MAG: zinc metallopeptidase [Planctomycetota bacterium]